MDSPHRLSFKFYWMDGGPIDSRNCILERIGCLLLGRLGCDGGWRGPRTGLCILQPRDQGVGSILYKDVEDTEGRQGRPRSHNRLGRGYWLAARRKGADDVAAGTSEVGNQRPYLPHLGWSIARLVMPPGWKRGVCLGCSAQPSRTPSPAQLLASAAQFSIWPAPDSSARPQAPRAHIHRARPGLGRSGAGPGGPGAAPRADGGTGRQGQGGGGQLGAGRAGSRRAGRRGLAGRRHVTGPL